MIRCPHCNHSFRSPEEEKYLNLLTFIFILIVMLIIAGLVVKAVF